MTKLGKSPYRGADLSILVIGSREPRQRIGIVGVPSLRNERCANLKALNIEKQYKPQMDICMMQCLDIILLI